MSFNIAWNALNKGWNRYYIMHKNRRVATVREDGTCTVYYKSFLPYNLQLEELDDLQSRKGNLDRFIHWCSTRYMLSERKYFKEISNSLGVKQAVTDRDRALIAISYHAVCLTDVYWVKASDEKTKFQDISLYHQSLSNAFADVSLTGKYLTVQNEELLENRDVAGDVATSGVAPKAWIREDGEFYLLKDGELRDVQAELLASRIADCFDFDHVSYEPTEFGGQKVSRSKLITSEEQSIVAMEYIDIYCVNQEIDREELVLRKDAYSFYMMNIFDYLIGNTDRHWGNWGFWVDNKTNKLGSLYSLMDFNKAFTAYDNLEGSLCQTTSKRMSQKMAAIEAAKRIGLNQLRSVDANWFTDKAQYDMFSRRLELLQQQTT